MRRTLPGKNPLAVIIFVVVIVVVVVVVVFVVVVDGVVVGPCQVHEIVFARMRYPHRIFIAVYLSVCV